MYLDNILSLFFKKWRGTCTTFKASTPSSKRESVLCQGGWLSFRERWLHYVNPVVDKHGIKVNPKKLETITKWHRPLEIEQLRSFLGFCNHIRSFIHNNFALVTPLTSWHEVRLGSFGQRIVDVFMIFFKFNTYANFDCTQVRGAICGC